MNDELRFIEPLDVLFLRGNKLFGDPGSFGQALVPPWPSVVAGALRSRMLVDDRIDPQAFARGEVVHPTLGTPERPGTFAVKAFHLARRHVDGRVEPLFALPADVSLSSGPNGHPEVNVLRPLEIGRAKGLRSSACLPLQPVLQERLRSKALDGYWLVERGWSAYLRGKTPVTTDLVSSAALWRLDHRVGVGLDAATRRAADGRLFSTQAIAMVKGAYQAADGDGDAVCTYDAGFVVAVSGASLAASGVMRFGGDGRAAAISSVPQCLPEPDYAGIASARRCRLVLTSPGIFNGGWLPNGASQTGDEEYRFRLGDVAGRLVCAVVPRAQIVSGWNLARRQPKPAAKAVPSGAVYWLQDLEASPDALRKLVERGLWSQPCEDESRRAEGFNRFSLAAY